MTLTKRQDTHLNIEGSLYKSAAANNHAGSQINVSIYGAYRIISFASVASTIIIGDDRYYSFADEGTL